MTCGYPAPGVDSPPQKMPSLPEQAGSSQYQSYRARLLPLAACPRTAPTDQRFTGADGEGLPGPLPLPTTMGTAWCRAARSPPVLLALSFPLLELPYFLLWVSAGDSHRHVTDLKHTNPWFGWSWCLATCCQNCQSPAKIVENFVFGN